MVWVGKEGDQVGCIFIDGFAPGLEFYEETNWKEFEKQGKIKYPHKLIKMGYKGYQPTEIKLINTFWRTALEIRRYSCLIEKQGHPSAYTFHTLGKRWYSLNKFVNGLPQYTKEQKHKLQSILPIFDIESQHDGERGLDRYMMNIITFKTDPEIRCTRLDECCRNWIKTLNFHIKAEEDYYDYKSFEGAVDELISYYVGHSEIYNFLC